MQGKIIQQGAEAVLIRKGNVLLKRRVRKGYRIQELDEPLRKRRTKREAKLLEKAGKIIAIPRVLGADEKAKEINMEFISGKKLSDNLDEMKNWREICRKIGENIAKLHDVNIIHGDLTTSNMIWSEKKLDSTSLINKTRSARKLSQKPEQGDEIDLDDDTKVGGKGRLFFIDFGLGFQNGRVEDKAVDLYLIKEALEAKHFKSPEDRKSSAPATSKKENKVEDFEQYFKEVLKGYKLSKNFKEVLKRLEKVEKRGRYKAQY